MLTVFNVGAFLTRKRSASKQPSFKESVTAHCVFILFLL